MKQGSVAKPASSRGAAPAFSITRPFAPAEPLPPTASGARHGHEFASVAVRGGAPVQRAKIPATKTKKKSKAEDRMLRWQKRSKARRLKNRLAAGRYDTPTGAVTVSNFYGQLMTKSRMGDYGGESFGGLPAYDAVTRNLPSHALDAALLGGKVPGNLTSKQKLAASLATGLTYISEEDREPGYAKFLRALARKRIAQAKAEHPFDPKVNPAVKTGGAQEMRDLLEGKSTLSKEQREAVDEHASDSSADEDDYYGIRKNIIKLQK